MQKLQRSWDQSQHPLIHSGMVDEAVLKKVREKIKNIPLKGTVRPDWI
jgi:hypothetical protein